MPNIYDVAREAGVSRSTVSRVINNQKSVKEDKRLRVLEAIEKLNYTPNATARALAMNKTNTIGIIARELTEQFNANFINGVHYSADHMNYGAIFCMRTLNDKSNINYIDFLNKKVDGFIFIGENTVTKEELVSLSRSNIPVVAMEIEYPVDSITFLNVNNYESAYSAVQYLYELGHRRIVNLTANEMTQEKESRNRGFNNACSELGMEFYETYEAPYDLQESRTTVRNFIPKILKNKVTAGFCYNNIIAVALSEALILNGKAIPQDFSVVGFDDIHYGGESKVALPEITSIKQPQQEMAAYAVKKLIEEIERTKGSEIEAHSQIFECELRIHDSTGPAKEE